MFTRYLNRFCQTVVVTHLLLQIANWFGYSMGIRLDYFFRYVVLPVSAVAAAWWSAQNRNQIKARLIDWSQNKQNQLLVADAGLSMAKYLWLFIVDMVGWFKRYIFNLYNLTLVLLMVILLDIFVISLYSDVITITLSLYWFLITVFNKLEGRFSLLLSIAFLPMCAVLTALHHAHQAEKCGVWVFIFLAIGVFRLIWEEIRSKKRYFQIEDLTPEIISGYHRIKAWVYLRYEIEKAREDE